LSVRLPHLAALALVLATGAMLLLHGAATKALPGVALTPARTARASDPPAAKATQRRAGTPAASANKSNVAAKSNRPSHGPSLASTQIAPFTYEIYPKTSPQLNLAEAGFQINVHQVSPLQEKVVISNQLGGGTALQQSFRATDRAYWIEASYGDDAPGQDANLGDDGFVLTDAQGYITQN
jgi:hypothetical protein